MNGCYTGTIKPPTIKISGDAAEVEMLLQHFRGKDVKITKKIRKDGGYNCYVKCYYLTEKERA